MPFKRLYSRRLLVGTALALFGFDFFWTLASAQTAPLTPAQIKVGYLFNFASYTAWPRGILADTNAPFAFGILGENPFGEDIEYLKARPVQGRRVVIKTSKRTEEMQDCQLIFISSSEKERLPQIMKTLEGTRILTVSEMDGFLEQNGMINLYLAPLEGQATVGTIRFEINQRAVEKAGLRINSYVLKLARNRK